MNVLHNALSEQVFKKLSSTIFSNSVTWFFNGTAYNDTDVNGIVDSTQLYNYSYSHLAWSNGESNSALGPLLETIFLMLCDNSNQKLDKLIRIRIGSISVTSKNIINEPHIDDTQSHLAGLLYLNNSDGDTIFYDNYFNPTLKTSGFEQYQKIKDTIAPIKSITPEANKFVWFNGFQYHGSTSPTTVPRRIVINFNYTVK